MQVQGNQSKALPVILTLLVLATLITGVLAANFLLEMGDSTPTATISIPAITDASAQSGNSAEYISTQSSAAAMTTQANTTVTSRISSSVLAAAPLDLLMEDGRTIWSGDTEVDIFSISYDNDAGETTVNSVYKDKVIAPGTSDQYLVYIENNGNAAVDYTLTAEGSASFTMDGETYMIPVEVRLTDSEKNDLVGSEDTWAAVEELDTVSDSGVLSGGYYTSYTLDWQWLYEQEDTEAGDSYDTMLGNLAASGETLAVTIRFIVHAENDEDENAIGGYPKTGDYQPIVIWIVVVMLLFIVFLYLLSSRKKENG